VYFCGSTVLLLQAERLRDAVHSTDIKQWLLIMRILVLRFCLASFKRGQ
jgi:hypothetical protein